MGSNTIRLSVFKVGDGDIKPVFQKKIMAGLADYVNDKGELSEKGILRAVSALQEFRDILSGIGIRDIYAFATASLRNVRNTEEARASICAKTGIELQVLSGKEEAVYGYLGATRHMKRDQGVLVDIGGGSTELVFYKDGEILQALSMPVGSLNMYSKYVKTLFPNESELRSIARAVRTQLDGIDKSAAQYELICGVGGTIRTACKLNNEIFGAPSSNREMAASNIDEIIETVRYNDKSSFGYILKIAPDRIHTIIPGMTILSTVADYFRCTKIHVSSQGVREGYLYQKLIDEGIIHE
ncbi:MAG TPA: hypothetical protein VN446_00250 [Candidatus Acidoferrum sp.]|nr:hypothetical protein [Candidatus Acidoferrum sp.]